MDAVQLLEPGEKLLGVLTGADLVILGLVLAGAAIGFWSGFVWMLVLTGSMVGCMWVTLVYHPVVAGFMGSQFSEPVRLMGSAAVVFIGAVIVCYLVAYLFRDVLNALKPQLPDRIVGVGFGVLLGLLLSSFLSFLVLEYSDEAAPIRPHVEESVLARPMGRFFGYTLPDRLRKSVEKTAAGAK